MTINIKNMLKECGLTAEEAAPLIMEAALGVGQTMLQSPENQGKTVAFTGTDEKTNKRFQLTVSQL